MNLPKAYGTFTKRGEHIFRTSAFIQWGDAKQSVGSALLLNPGSAHFDKIDTKLTALHTLGYADGEIYTDPTMKQLIKVVEKIYEREDINGRFHIYNLFNLQNTDNIHAIDQFENLVERGEYDISESLVTDNELYSHPWLYLGWGVKRKKHWKSLENTKISWQNIISRSQIPTFGKKHSKTEDYYHPSYAIYHPNLIDEIVATYKENLLK
ncbi:MAG: hypothetical protein E7E18_01470 [Eubacterium sp.]|nr:hypothetical protein [Eubacterium sp.]